jgi:photosystem II stability/assembly factor-like uncharacterized protein
MGNIRPLKLLVILIITCNLNIVLGNDLGFWEMNSILLAPDFFKGTNILENTDTIVNRSSEASSWNSVVSGTVQNIRDVYFLDSNNGFLVGDSSTILNTANGGNLWIKQTCDSVNLYSVYFLNSNSGFALGRYGLFTGKVIYSGGVARGLVGAGGRLLRTTNGGSTWDTLSLPENVGTLRSIFFPDGIHGYIVGDYGSFLRTNDGGNNWEFIHLNDVYTSPGYYSKMLRSVRFTDVNTGYAVGYAYGYCFSPYYCSSLNQGMIFKTTDSGSNWNLEYATAAGEILYSVFFTDNNTGYAVGANGLILKTADGGVSWNTQTSGTTNSLTRIFFTDAGTGYITGDQGTILKTVDGGNNWSLQTAPTNNILLSVYFPNESTGYATGASGTILKYSIFTGINSILLSDNIRIFPNPTTGIFKVQIDEPLENRFNIEVYSGHGSLLFSKQMQNNRDLFQIDLSQYPSGLYFIKIISGLKAYHTRVIKQ